MQERIKMGLDISLYKLHHINIDTTLIYSYDEIYQNYNVISDKDALDEDDIRYEYLVPVLVWDYQPNKQLIFEEFKKQYPDYYTDIQDYFPIKLGQEAKPFELASYNVYMTDIDNQRKTKFTDRATRKSIEWTEDEHYPLPFETDLKVVYIYKSEEIAYQRGLDTNWRHYLPDNCEISRDYENIKILVENEQLDSNFLNLWGDDTYWLAWW